MAVLKCKMCGGDLEFSEGVSVANNIIDKVNGSDS